MYIGIYRYTSHHSFWLEKVGQIFRIRDCTTWFRVSAQTAATFCACDLTSRMSCSACASAIAPLCCAACSSSKSFRTLATSPRRSPSSELSSSRRWSSADVLWEAATSVTSPLNSLTVVASHCTVRWSFFCWLPVVELAARLFWRTSNSSCLGTQNTVGYSTTHSL